MTKPDDVGRTAGAGAGVGRGRGEAKRASGAGRASMAQVAAAAGVSGQTVSRVVNASPRVDPATRERVEKAMAELGYRPHRAARALRTGRSGVIGLVVTTLASVGNSRMLQAVVDLAAAHDYGVTVATVSASGGLTAAFDRLHDQGVDGAVVLNEASALAGPGALPRDLPLVIVDAPPGTAAATVSSDHRGGARAAVAHLVALGHREIAHLAGPDGSFAAAEREAGWREALSEAGLGPGELLRGDWSAESGYEADPPASATAVFSANDQMALGLIRSLAEHGRAVSGDVSVVGFDDVPESANYRPPLTTVRQDFAALAARAVEALLARIAEPSAAPGAEPDTASDPAIVPAPLVERASAAAPRDTSTAI